MTWLAVTLGAIVGAPLRYVIDEWVTDAATRRFAARPAWTAFPWGLLVVNVSGSATAGAVVALTDGTLRTFLLVGFCGAFTTYSGFGWETVLAWSRARAAGWAAVVVMPAACVAAFLLTWQVGTLATG